MENPKKYLSQNFLIDKNIREKIIKLTNLKNKKILEIGAGKGFLTEGIISQRPKELIIIEKDKNLYEKLLIKYGKIKYIKILNLDILKCNIDEYKNYIVISNLPYNITNEFLNKLFFCKNKIEYFILMIQKEVANKINPQEKGMNKYKYLMRYTSLYNICFNVSPNVFYPKPKVKSCVVKIKTVKIISNQIKMKFFINKIFNNKRKIIANLIPFKIKEDLILKKRVEELTFDEINYLFSKF